jgi:hypothetical protein
MIGEKLFRIFDGEDCNLSQFMEKTADRDEEFQNSLKSLTFNPAVTTDQLEWDLSNLLDLYGALGFLIGFVLGSHIGVNQKDALLEIEKISSMIRENNILP